jgi:hypothetical protein
MMILDEYVAEENLRKSKVGRNTPMLKRNSSRSERYLPPIRATSKSSARRLDDERSIRTPI